jgi:hypothetical protein
MRRSCGHVQSKHEKDGSFRTGILTQGHIHQYNKNTKDQHCFMYRTKDGRRLGKKDTVTKEYMQDPVIFADAFNKYLYHGRQVIKPERLKGLDTTEITVPYGSGGAGVLKQRYRDVLKTMMTDGDMAYCILGIENQSGIHYAMPVKNGLYDLMQLAHQVTETARSHKRERKEDADGHDISSDEYLSGFYKTDKLLPVVTLVIFYSAEKWDGPLTLREMYPFVDDALMQYVPDYRVNLIAPGDISEEEIQEFRSSLREVMLYIKYSKDKKRLREVVQKDENFHNLERQAAEVINVTTDSRLKYPEGQEVVNVCTAIEEIKIEGKIEGSVETYREVGFSLEDTIQRVAEKYGLSLQRAEEEVRRYWK